MPALFDAGDRRLVAGAVLLMLVLLLAGYIFRPAPVKQEIGTPSSYSSEFLGTKAAFVLLQESGYNVERWLSPPVELPDDGAGTTLIYAEPEFQGSSEDRSAVARFVSSGGRLIVMGAHGGFMAPLADTEEIPTNDLTPEPYQALVPSPLTRNAAEVTMVAPDQWKTLAPGQIAVFGDQGRPGVVWYRFGKGQVIWWAISSPMSNGGIREKDNLALLFNSLGPPPSHVLIDEYFHGVRRTLGSYFANTPLPWAAAQLALVFLALVFTFSRRSGPIWVPAAQSRLSALEFVNTLGDLYQSAHAAESAVGVAYQRLRLLLLRKLGLPSQVRLQDLARAAAARFALPEDALFHALLDSERAMRDIHLDDRRALELVRELHEYAARIEPAANSKANSNESVKPNSPKETFAWK